MTERHIGTHDQRGGFARIDRLEFAGLDSVTQDQLDRVRTTSLCAMMASQLSSIATMTMSLTF